MSRRSRAINPLAATICLVAGWALPAAAQLQHVPITEPLRLAGTIRPVKGAKAVYIVKLRAPGAASYRGTVSALGATKPSSGQGQRPDIQSAAVQAYARQLEQSHDRLLAAVGAAGNKMYSYRYSLNGFAAELTAAQASQLAQRDEVERIWADTDQRVNTNSSAIFLGLEDQTGGLRADLGLRGEDIVVGVIDSGVAPNHPSLLDALLVVSRLPDAMCVMKSSLVGNFLLGPAARLARYIPNDTLLGLATRAGEELRLGGHLVLFPEGTRTARKPVGPFTAAVAVVSRRTGVPVQAVFLDTDARYLGKGWSILSSPGFPLHFRARLGRRFVAPKDVRAFTAELESYFTSELGGVTAKAGFAATSPALPGAPHDAKPE